MPIYSSGQIGFSLPHIERITLGAGEDQVAKVGLVRGQVKDRLLWCMGQDLQQGVDRIGEVGDRASEAQAAMVYGAGSTAGCG